MIIVSNRVGLATVAAVLCALAIFGLVKAARAAEIGRGYAVIRMLPAASSAPTGAAVDVATPADSEQTGAARRQGGKVR
ncbi:MAG: hypothetical protein BGP06_21300 [Rhizobiales bacterium 65-9]|nr:hypothetical protein [Hyphomicrobiales bacterium]OJY36545.1 MAG: hypothetical protein BGP06_21300 [Rhizobiales bacterium 65-9]